MRYALFALLVAACQAPPYTAPVPVAIPSLQGPIPVLYVDTIPAVDSTKNLVGGYDYYGRRVLIRQEARRNRVTAHLIAWHEWCHVVMVDAGLKVDGPIVELICDAFAQARTAELTKPER
jgi:hypothetical protein